MSARIIKFPYRSNRPVAFKISFYTDEEILLAVIAINAFGNVVHKVNNYNLVEVDPVHVISCLEKALDCDLFSDKGRSLIKSVLDSVEQSYIE